MASYLSEDAERKALGWGHHPNMPICEARLRAVLSDLGVNYQRFVGLIEEHETLGFHEACEAALYEMSCRSLIIEPFLTDLARLTAAMFAERDRFITMPMAAE